jgi:hypothetical protein
MVQQIKLRVFVVVLRKNCLHFNMNLMEMKKKEMAIEHFQREHNKIQSKKNDLKYGGKLSDFNIL